MAVVSICAPEPEIVQLLRLHCPTCERQRRFACFHYAWYGWHTTCLRCGDSWSDGERMDRPFERAWRPKVIRRAWDYYRRYRR